LDATRAAPVEDIFCQTCKECGPSMLRLQKDVRRQEQRLKAREEELTEIIQISKKEQDEMKESRSRAGPMTCWIVRPWIWVRCKF